MNHNETVDFVTQFARFQPSFADWQSKEANVLAARAGTTAVVESRAMLASMSRTLRNVTTDEAAGALAAMEEGRLDVPPFGSLALSVRGWAMNERSGKRRAEGYDRENEQKFRCITCRDTGMVEVLNPSFVEWFRGTFAGYEANGFPADWRGAAYREWRTQRKGPLRHSALCSCDCERARIMRDELEAYRKGERRLKGEVLGPPACGVVEYVDGKTPLADAPVMFKETLAAWYAEHEPGSTREWEPDADEYDRRFG